MLIWLAVIIVTVFLDQLTKYLTVLHLKPIDTLPIIEDVFHLTYVENTGAAFGMMKDARWVFMITSTLAIIGILVYMFWKKPSSKLECLSLAFIVGGALACEVKPSFIRALEYAEGYHEAPGGKIVSSWKRDGEEILLTVVIPDGMAGDIVLPDGYVFSDGESCKPAVGGTYALRSGV